MGLPLKGVTNGLSKMLSLGKFKPSLGISALKKSVSESRISQKYDGLGVSEFENLDLGVSDFENVDLEISPTGRSIFYPLLTRRSYNLPYLRLVPFIAISTPSSISSSLSAICSSSL